MVGDILTFKELAICLKLNEKITYRLESELRLQSLKIDENWRFKRIDTEQ
nr:DNA-binding protein [Vibrio owensii]